jgi:SAM-dependent methyltransferase
MQDYNRAFARIYDQQWGMFANHVAPLIWEFYESTPIGQTNKSLLDVCCGTGELALFFLEKGYRVVGIDLSADMLAHARKKTAEYIEAEKAAFVEADAARFSLDERCGLVVSTFDALNHLPDSDALRGCFQAVRNVLVPGGLFIFDLNTRKGLRERWNGIHVEDTEESLIVNRGIYDGGERAYTRISGFVRGDDGAYERFEGTFYNTVFEMATVKGWLLAIGYKDVHFAHVLDLGAPVDAPEAMSRVFIVAGRS